MAIVRKSLDDVRGFTFSPESRARLDAMTPEEIEQNALDDPDNPPMTEEELARAVAGRDVRSARERTGLSQAKFANKYRINPARLRDWEQGRSRPDSVALAYIRVIDREPEAVERALTA